MLATSASGSLWNARSQSTATTARGRTRRCAVDVVVGGDLRGRRGVLGADTGQTATCPSRRPASSPPSRTRFSNAATARRSPPSPGGTVPSPAAGRPSRRARGGGPARRRGSRQRTFDHEVHQHHALLFVGVVHGRAMPASARAQTRIAALRVSEAVPADLEPQQVRARASVDPQRRGPEAPPVVGVILVTDAGSATSTIAASAADRRFSAIAENTSAIRARPTGQ